MKKNDIPIILRLVADVLYVYGFLLLLPMGIGVFAREYPQALLFGGGAILFIPSFFVARRRLSVHGVTQHHAAIALALTWLLLSVLSFSPFLLSGMTWVDALFEAFSAWTDTGLTMIPHPEKLPISLSVFRILMQWISGLGIVLFMLFLRGAAPRAAHSLFQAEGRSEDFSLNIWHIGRTIVAIYVGYTLLGFAALWILGVPPFHALTHAITSLSTGGFSTNSVGVGVYGALPSLVAMGLMLCGGISFNAHQALLSGNIKKFFSNPEIRLLFLFIIGGTVLLLFELWLVEGHALDRVLESAFYVITTLSTCGAGTTMALSEVPDVYIFTLTLLMISGAVYGSTSGALKLWRLMVLGKVIQREIKRPFYPAGTIMPIRIGNTVIAEQLALQTAAYVLLYLLIAVLGSLIFMLFGYRSLYAMFTVFSAQGNVGLNAMPDALYYEMPVFLKLQLIFHMLIGRMEILPLLYVLRGIRE